MNQNTKIKRNIYLKIILLEIILVISMRFLVPVLANYPPYSEEHSFQLQFELITHNMQYVLLGVSAVFIHIFFINRLFKKIFIYMKKNPSQVSREEAELIRQDCFKIRPKIALIQLILLILILSSLFVLMDMTITLIVKFTLMYFTFFLSAAIISSLLIRADIDKIVMSTYRINEDVVLNFKRGTFYKSLLFGLIPFLIVIIIALTMFGYARVSEEKGNSRILLL